MSNHDFDRQWLGTMYAAMGWLTLSPVVMSASAVLTWQVSWFWAVGIIIGGWFGLVSLRHLFIQTGRIHQMYHLEADQYLKATKNQSLRLDDLRDEIVTLKAALANCRLSREGKRPAAEASGDLLASAADERKQIVYHLENYREF